MYGFLLCHTPTFSPLPHCPLPPQKFTQEQSWKLKIDLALPVSLISSTSSPSLLFSSLPFSPLCSKLKGNSFLESVHSFIPLIPLFSARASISPTPSFIDVFASLSVPFLYVFSHSPALSTRDTLIHLFLHSFFLPLSVHSFLLLLLLALFFFYMLLILLFFLVLCVP